MSYVARRPGVSDRAMTRAGRSFIARTRGDPMNVTPIHVSIISEHGIDLQPSRESTLKKALRGFHASSSGRLVLHHGCGGQADDTAHDFACGAGGEPRATPPA